jgi:hypothetical protein
MGSTAPSTNAKILNAASLLMTHLAVHLKASSFENACGSILFLRDLPHAALLGSILRNAQRPAV